MTLPDADTLAAALVGRPLHTYLWREARIMQVEDGVVVIAGDRRVERARVPLADIQAGLDQLGVEGEVPLTIDALGPSAKYVAAILVEVEGVAFGDAPPRVMLSGRPAGG